MGRRRPVTGLSRQHARLWPFRLLAVERLDRRALCAVTAIGQAVPLKFVALDDAHVSHFLSSPTEVDFYTVVLGRGDAFDATVSAQQTGSGLSSLLRVFDTNGDLLALDNQQGSDPRLRFQAADAGIYLIAVSSAPNPGDPGVMASDVAGGSIGLYDLDVKRTTGNPLMPDLTGGSFRLGLDMAASGNPVPVDFTVENRGGADAGNFQVQVLFGATNVLDNSATVLATLQRSDLLVSSADGRDFSAPAGFHIALPTGVSSGPGVIGLRILSDPAVPDAVSYDKSGVHRGADWEPLTVVTPSPLGATDLSQVDAGLFTEESGTLGTIQASAWSFTVSSSLGDGEIRAEVVPTDGNPSPRLTLSGPDGELLIQSDSGQLVQSLGPGTYVLAISAQSGEGGYRLSTSYVPTSQPNVPLTSGTGTAWVTVGDLNGDGVLDIVTANRIDNTVSVFMGVGDGTFRPPTTYSIGARVWRVTVADVRNDGKLDILTANKGDNTVSLLLGNGDGTFQPEKIIPTGTRPGGVTVADIEGDGKPDMIISNYADSTVWVLRGDGDGTFGPPTSYSTTDGPGFAGPGPPVVADVNGDGIPDLLYPNYVSRNVAVRLGNGDGTFGSQRTFPAKEGAYSLKVVDLNGDGKPDVVVANAVDNSVSVLLGQGDGTFGPQQVFPVGFDPYSMVVADLKGDGKIDVVTSNRGDNTVSVLLGNGNGTFQPQETFPTGKSPRGVAVGDFTGDGHVGIVTANQGDNTASVLLGNGDGTFVTGPQQSVPTPNLRPFQVVVADVNRDGRPDIVTANRSDNSVSVLLDNGDGSYQTKETYATGRLPISVAVADLNGDGIPDIVTANYGGSAVSILEGNGDGTFRPHQDITVGSDPYDVKVADVNGDGKPDLVVTNKNDNTVSVLLGNGDGRFQPQEVYHVASGPYEVVVDDLTGNGIPDLVVSHFSASVVDVLMGNGDGTFQPAREFPVGARPYGLAVADVSGDGKPDIITANYHAGTVSVLLGRGDGTFAAPQSYLVQKAPNEVQVADLTGDGKPDIITANYGSNSVSLLAGNGDGTFQPQRAFPAGIGPASLAVADLHGDGKPDIVTGNRNASTVSVLMGIGDGTFQSPVALGVGKDRYSVAVADLTGDGKPDLVTTNVRQNTVTVQLGNGDGTFESSQPIPVGPAPTSVAVADLNGDGRPDLVTANSSGDTVSVLLGNGDGTFNVQQTFAVGRSPRSVKIADLAGDGKPDLIVANYNDNTVSVLLGNGDGTFQPQKVYPVGMKPYSLAVADLAGDGKPDLVVANTASDTVSVLVGNGDGTFQPQRTYATGRQPFNVAAADLNGDGIPDIVTANAFDNTVSVLLGNGDGTFKTQRSFPVGARPYAVAAVDVRGDGRPELVTTNYGSNSVTLLANDGHGAFGTPRTFATDQLPVQTVVADVNGDGRPDLVTVNNHDGAAGVLLGSGAGNFQPVSAASGVGLRDTPILADVNSDGILDSVVLDRSGNILLRKGLPGATGAFAPPVILNPGRPARDIALIHTGSGVAIAAADAHFDPISSTNQFLFSVSLYTIAPDGTVSRRTAFSSTALPVRLAAADLAGDGLDDLVVANSLSSSVSISMQSSPGQFAPPLIMPVGIIPSDISIADINDDGLPDIVVSDQASGDVSVLLNDRAHSFSKSLRFRADTGLYGLDTTAGSPVVSSSAQSVSAVAGDFMGSGLADLAVVNGETHNITILAANGNGGFADPTRRLKTSTSDDSTINNRPGAIVAGDFNRDGHLDVAVLMEDTGELWIYSGNGDGTFRHTFSIPVGDQATGLSVAPGRGAGLLDLLVGNGFGDVLHLEGKGDGTFQISGKRVSLSVVPNLLGPGQAGVLVGNQQNNRVTVQAPSADGTQFAPVQTLAAGTSSSQLAPGDVQWSVLDKGATLPDAVVVSTGSNAVVVYRTMAVTNGVPSFAPTPRTYFVGTAPASVTVADINGDGIPDMLVANEGSNDVSVLFGSYDANGDWQGIPGPRLKSGGDGPIEVTVTEPNGAIVPGLAIINGGSGTVTELPGVGRGFFDDRKARTLFNLGAAVVQPPSFASGSSVGFAVTAGGDLVRFDLSDPTSGASDVYAGQHVVAAQALAGGQVVVALADGAVNLLVPRGGGLSVASQLRAQGDTPSLPSAIEVVSTPSGHLNVLVSSQGSDTIFVFAQASAPSEGGAPTVNAPLTSFFNSGQATVVTATQVIALTSSASAASSSQSAASTGASASASFGSLGGVVSSAIGLSLGTFSSLGNGAVKGPASTVLVSVEGNTYMSVPVLDLGPGQEDATSQGGLRMPWLSSMYPLGDTSPLTRFVTGLEEALRDYRGAEDAPLSRGSGPLNDPWSEDLFHLHRQDRPPPSGREKDLPNEPVGPQAVLPNARLEDSWMDAHPGDADVTASGVEIWSSAAARVVAGARAMGVLLAGIVMTPPMFMKHEWKAIASSGRVPAKMKHARALKAQRPVVSFIDE
jgi:hypothetical protein